LQTIRWRIALASPNESILLRGMNEAIAPCEKAIADPSRLANHGSQT